MYTSSNDSYENDTCHEEIVVEEDFPRVFQEVSYDVFSPIIEEKDDKQVFELTYFENLPIYDEYENEYADLISFQQTETIIQEDFENISQTITYNYHSLFDDYEENNIKDHKQLIIYFSGEFEHQLYDSHGLDYLKGKEDMVVHVQDAVLPAEDTQKSSCFQLKHEEDNNVIHVVDSTKWKSCPLDQLGMSCHEFHDPIADRIESLLSKNLRATGFGMLHVCNIR